jgi:hypothetical protein
MKKGGYAIFLLPLDALACVVDAVASGVEVLIDGALFDPGVEEAEAADDEAVDVAVVEVEVVAVDVPAEPSVRLKSSVVVASMPDESSVVVAVDDAI